MSPEHQQRLLDRRAQLDMFAIGRIEDEIMANATSLLGVVHFCALEIFNLRQRIRMLERENGMPQYVAENDAEQKQQEG